MGEGRRVTSVAILLALLMTAACSRPPAPTDVAAGGETDTDTDTGDRSAASDPSGTPGTDGTDPALDPTGEPLDIAGGTTTITAADGSVATPSTGDGGAGGGDGGGGGGAPPADGSAPPPARPGVPDPLFTGADDTRGITKDKIVLCVHAALTYGAAFNTSKEDLNVYWTAVNEAGGIHGRTVEVHYENDNYSPDTAIEAAKSCKDKHDPFALIGGIGFDQIPAVRSWAENNEMLYIHHTATVNGSEGKRYSFTPLATTEKMGEMFAELAASRFSGQKVGVIKRQSPNWEPGIDGFKKVAKARGVPIALEREVAVNKGTYLQDIVDLRNAGSEVVFLWLNALESTEFITQTWAQGWKPQFMIFPFNLTTQTLGAQALDPPIVGVSMHNAYSAGDTSGPFAAYADDIRLFEAQYDEHRPDADYQGVGGDLMFLNWASQKATHDFFLRCGPDCTRSRFAHLLTQTTGTATPSVCAVDFTRADSNGGRRGGYLVSAMETYRAPSGKINFRNSATCIEHL